MFEKVANNNKHILNIIGSILSLAKDEPDVNDIHRILAVLSNDGIDQHVNEQSLHNFSNALRSLSVLASVSLLVNGEVEVDREEVPKTPNTPNQEHCNDSTSGNSCQL